MQKTRNDDKIKPSVVNGINTEGVKALIGHVAKDPENANTHWHVCSHWREAPAQIQKLRGTDWQGVYQERFYHPN